MNKNLSSITILNNWMLTNLKAMFIFMKKNVYFLFEIKPAVLTLGTKIT